MKLTSHGLITALAAAALALGAAPAITQNSQSQQDTKSLGVFTDSDDLGETLVTWYDDIRLPWPAGDDGRRC